MDELTLQGNIFSDEYIHHTIGFGKCSAGTCKTDEEIRAYQYLKGSIILAKNKYYDESDLVNPIKERVDQIDQFPVDGYQVYRKLVYVRENEVIFLNGTTTTFYDAVEGPDEDYVVIEQLYPVLGSFSVHMSTEKRIYRQVQRIIPDLTSRRSLATTNTTTTTEEENREFVYHFFTILSQIGGFCYLLKMVFGSCSNIFIKNTKSASLINIVKKVRMEKSFKSGMKKNSSEIVPERQLLREESKQELNTSYQNLKAEIDNKISEHKDNGVESEIRKGRNKKDLSEFSQLKRTKSENSKLFIPFNFKDVISKTIICCRKRKQHKEMNKIDKFRIAEEILFNEMDVIRVLNQIKEIREANRIMKDNFKNLVTNPGILSILTQKTQDDAPDQTPSQMNQNVPYRTIKPQTASQNNPLSPPTNPPQNPPKPPKGLKLSPDPFLQSSSSIHKINPENKKEITQKREIEQMAVSSIYKIVDDEINDFKNNPDSDNNALKLDLMNQNNSQYDLL